MYTKTITIRSEDGEVPEALLERFDKLTAQHCADHDPDPVKLVAEQDDYEHRTPEQSNSAAQAIGRAVAGMIIGFLFAAFAMLLLRGLMDIGSFLFKA